jgi:Helix-turn-helix domain
VLARSTRLNWIGRGWDRRYHPGGASPSRSGVGAASWTDGHREELATFLRNRRTRLRPPEVGLPEGPCRRTPGLRRQEVAQLAGMSIDYYIRLEQARRLNPSTQVLAALGRLCC